MVLCVEKDWLEHKMKQKEKNYERWMEVRPRLTVVVLEEIQRS